VRIYTKGVPGGVVVQTVKMTATVTAIDQAKRKATLLASDGKKFTVKVGPEAVNFDQVRVGDQVNATVTEKMVVSLDDKEAPSPEGAAAVVARAPKGDQPGGLVAETTQVTAKIITIDLEKRTATLQFEDGITQTFPVRADVDLSRLKVGEQMVFRVTEMIAISVEKPQ
jgi:translation elongation factor P/translation initiation factor 5A